MKKLDHQEKNIKENFSKLIEGIDFYFENGLMVLTAHFLKKRGYCCGNNCRNCPYELTKNEKL
ncbi:MAG: DUF5522 domain-containing protein [Actinomycetota bacterium]